jgi:uncharacterized membrane protein
MEMNWLGNVVVGSAVTALLALVLSLTRLRIAARRLAQASLWLTLLGGPLAIAFQVFTMWRASDSGAQAPALGRALSQLTSSGALLLPCTFIAGLALKRANAAVRR